MNLTRDDISYLIREFGQSDLSEMKITDEGTTFELKRKAERAAAAPAVVMHKAPSHPGPDAASPENDRPSKTEDGESSDEAVRAPLAGGFYRASKPGAAPYVEPGKHVEKGDIIGLIEAMKMMSEVPAPYAGTVKEIRAEDGVFAGYNDVLMTIVRD